MWTHKDIEDNPLLNFWISLNLFNFLNTVSHFNIQCDLIFGLLIPQWPQVLHTDWLGKENKFELNMSQVDIQMQGVHIPSQVFKYLRSTCVYIWNNWKNCHIPRTLFTRDRVICGGLWCIHQDLECISGGWACCSGFSLGIWDVESWDSPFLKMLSPRKFCWVPLNFCWVPMHRKAASFYKCINNVFNLCFLLLFFKWWLVSCILFFHISKNILIYAQILAKMNV